MNKKIFIISIIFTFLISFSVPANIKNYIDIQNNSWYTEAVNNISDKNIMQGYDDKFRPQDNVTRSELAQTINNLLNYMEENNIENTINKNVIVQSLDSVASGVVIQMNDDKYILTAKHVVDNENTLFITFYDKSFEIGKIYKVDANSDLALIRCNIPEGISPINLASDYKLGQTIYAIGNPDNYIFSLSKGIISYVNREYENNLYIQFDALVNNGSSGGALIDIKGNLVGIISKRTIGSGFGLAVPLEQINTFLKEGE